MLSLKEILTGKTFKLNNFYERIWNLFENERKSGWISCKTEVKSYSIHVVIEHQKAETRWDLIHSYNNSMIEWVSDCCLMPIQQFFSYIMARTS